MFFVIYLDQKLLLNISKKSIICYASLNVCLSYSLVKIKLAFVVDQSHSSYQGWHDGITVLIGYQRNKFMFSIWMWHL